MTVDPDVEIVICRHATTGTQAHGYDPLITLILARADFLQEDSLGQRYHRLDYDQGTATENAQAADATRMLTACRYTVRLAPGLDEDLNARQREISLASWQGPVHPDLPNT
jgi:hypothetical protein